MSAVVRTDDAIDVALSARRAMQLLRDSSLPGTEFFQACELSCHAIDAVAREAKRMDDLRRVRS